MNPSNRECVFFQCFFSFFFNFVIDLQGHKEHQAHQQRTTLEHVIEMQIPRY